MRVPLETPQTSFAPSSVELPSLDRVAVFGVAVAIVALHLATNGRYGFHRDELQFLSDARHLDWGFVAYPPLTPFLERILLAIFGLSLEGLRLFSVIAQGLLIVVSGMMARELGGGRLAQFATALCVALSPLPLFEGTEFQYSSFDMLWWVLIAFFILKALRTDDARWWMAVGVFVGLGLLTKYSIVFFVAGVLAGVVLTPARRFLWTGGFWAGIAIALLIFMPNLVWLIRHDFISYHFLQHIHARDVGAGRADEFLVQQFWLCVNLCAAPLWLAGLWFYLRDRRYRMMAWMYLVPLVMFGVAKGRFYYLAAAYPMLLAMGAVAGERWMARLKRKPRWAVEGVFFAGVVTMGAFVCAILIPLAESGPLRDFALSKNGDLREEFGWQELVDTVAGIRDSLPAAQRNSVGIVVGNYGEEGAIEMLGAARHLPPPISGTNSGWLRTYPLQPPAVLIVVGFSAEQADKRFTGCRLAGHNGNSLGIRNEEVIWHPDIFVCGAPRKGWPGFWKDFQSFG